MRCTRYVGFWLKCECLVAFFIKQSAVPRGEGEGGGRELGFGAAPPISSTCKQFLAGGIQPAASPLLLPPFLYAVLGVVFSQEGILAIFGPSAMDIEAFYLGESEGLTDSPLTLRRLLV